MKRIFMAAMALVMVALVGCQKDDNATLKSEVTVTFTVADKQSFDNSTRAVKSGWVNGDEILIIFEGSEGWLDFTSHANTLTLKKTADGWDAIDTNLPALANLANGKKFYAIYHTGEISLGNMTDATTYYTAYINSYSTAYTSKTGIEYMSYSGTYTLSGSEINLGSITMARPSKMFQISVDNLCNEPNVYDWMMVLYDEEGNFISNTNCERIYLYCYAPNGDMSIVRNVDSVITHGVDIDGDKVFYINNMNSEATVKYININFGSSSYFYEITPKNISDFFGKAWLLPAINMNDDGSLKAGSAWTTSI